MPAILAASALMGIVGFVVCAFSTWILFQKRTEFAIRTLRGAYIAEIEQSLLEPAAKSAVASEIEKLAADLERGKYENWQAAGIMQRLQRLPVIQWGELQAVEAFLAKSEDDKRQDQIQQLQRLRRAVELDKVTSFDFEDVLQPVRRSDPDSASGHVLVRPMTEEHVGEVVQRARLVSDRAKIPEESFEDVRIESIVRREIERGASIGGF
jgi:hypothetical protein